MACSVTLGRPSFPDFLMFLKHGAWGMGHGNCGWFRVVFSPFLMLQSSGCGDPLPIKLFSWLLHDLLCYKLLCTYLILRVSDVLPL